jgi:hypothetical protein
MEIIKVRMDLQESYMSRQLNGGYGVFGCCFNKEVK